MNTDKTTVFKKLYEHSHVHPSDTDPLQSNGDVFVKDISRQTGLTIPLVKRAITALRKLKALYIEPEHDLNNLNKIMPFIIPLNPRTFDFLKEDQGGVS